MRVQNRFISAGYRLFYLTAALYGVLLSLFMPGAVMWSTLPYFSMQSNLICFALILVLSTMDLVNIPYQKLRIFRLFRFCCLILLGLTFTLYHAVIRPRLQLEFPAYFAELSLSEILLNTVMPIMFGLDYLLFDEKGGFRWWHPLAALVLPAAYAVYVFLYSENGGLFRFFEHTSRAPYFFLDYQEIGLPVTLRWIAWITLGLLVAGYLLLAVDAGLSFWWTKRQEQTSAAEAKQQESV